MPNSTLDQPTRTGGLPANDPLRSLGEEKLGEALDGIIEGWPTLRASEHLRLEISAVAYRGRSEPQPLPRTEVVLEMVKDLSPEERVEFLDELGSSPALAPGAPVPGCGCRTCTGIPEAAPRTWLSRKDGAGREAWERTVEEARSRPLLDVARGLGMEPKKAGREYVARCPFHEDRTPSLSLSPTKGLWHCFSCGRGGDGISLVMQVKNLDFTGAVKEMAPAA